jgi:hypothetical protein
MLPSLKKTSVIFVPLRGYQSFPETLWSSWFPAHQKRRHGRRAPYALGLMLHPLKKTFVVFVPFVVIDPSRKLCGLRGFPHIKSGVTAAALHIVPGFWSAGGNDLVLGFHLLL